MKMVNMRVIALLMAFLMLLLFVVSLSSAEHIVEVEVSPDPTETLPGEEAVINVTVINDGWYGETYLVRLVERPGGGKGKFRDGSGNDHNWQYEFTENGRRWIEIWVPGYSSKTIHLKVCTPDDAELDYYTYVIKVEDFPFEKQFVISEINVIPEFATIAIPIAIVLGLVFFLFRRKK